MLDHQAISIKQSTLHGLTDPTATGVVACAHRVLSTQNRTKPITAMTSPWARTSESPEIVQPTANPSHPNPVLFHPSHYTASRVRSVRYKQQGKSNTCLFNAGKGPPPPGRGVHEGRYQAQLSLPDTLYVWTITSRDERRGQPNVHFASV